MEFPFRNTIEELGRNDKDKCSSRISNTPLGISSLPDTAALCATGVLCGIWVEGTNPGRSAIACATAIFASILR
jgi:hypothetical protein